jgi:hypothetical protein
MKRIEPFPIIKHDLLIVFHQFSWLYFLRKVLKTQFYNLYTNVPDLASNFAIAITGMTVFCIVLVAVPIGLMLRNSFKIRGKIKAS